MIKVLIADDQPLYNECLKKLIEDKDLHVVGCAKNGQEAFYLCRSLSPDVVLMDIVMPECDGICGTKLIKAKFPFIKILMLTTFEEEDKISHALRNGADGYLLKDVSSDTLKSAIRSSHGGISTLHPKIFKKLVGGFDVRGFDNDTSAQDMITAFHHFSDKEKAIVRLIAKGKSNKDIASIIYLSEGRVRNIISDILSKLNLNDRTQLAIFAVTNKLVL